MPIILTFTSGRQLLVEGDNWKKLDGNAAPFGTISLKTVPEGLHIGVIKANVETYEEFSDAAWALRKDAAEKAREEQRAARDAEVKKNAQDQAARMEKARLDALRAKRPLNRLRLAFGREAR
jgi:hypothetical protein